MLFLSALLMACGTQKVRIANNRIPVNIPDSAYPSDTIKIIGHTPYTQKHYPQRIAYFKQHPLQMHDVVFVGNSITEMGGNWSVRLNQANIQNRGIGGDISTGVINRLGEITYVKPAAVFLLIGINDINHTPTPPAQIAANILTLSQTIHSQSPKTKVFVQTIFPSRRNGIKAKIEATNNWIKKNKRKGHYTIIDMHQLLVDDEGLLRREFTNDGIHLTEMGYLKWTTKLKSYFR